MIWFVFGCMIAVQAVMGCWLFWLDGEEIMTVTWAKYRRKGNAEMRPYDYVAQESVDGISISDPDRVNGSPKAGDMIARNPNNPDDQWLVAQKYFSENFEPLT